MKFLSQSLYSTTTTTSTAPRCDMELNLSGSWQQAHSVLYNIHRVFKSSVKDSIHCPVEIVLQGSPRAARAGILIFHRICSYYYPRFIMAQSAAANGGKKLIRIDVSSDTVCPWCFVGKRNLDKAIASSKDQYDFEVRWHPYLLNPSASKVGVVKKDFYREKFGSRSEQIEGRMTEVFRGLGLQYDMSGLTGNTLDSHRLITFAGHQGFDKQHALVEELCLGYFTQGKYIVDQDFLIECATKVGIEGASEFLQDPNAGVSEVNEELEKYSKHITGVPYYVINGKHKLSGGQAPEVFMRAFQRAANESS